MKKIFLILIIFILSLSSFLDVFAWRWCCSWHWWQAYCATNWRRVCNDWTYSPTCTCWWWTTSSSYSYYSSYKSIKNWYISYWTLYCDNWYTPSYNYTYCIKVPENAHEERSDKWDVWMCNDWYKEVWNKCIKNNDNNELCNKKYPWTIYRTYDNKCICPWNNPNWWNNITNCWINSNNKDCWYYAYYDNMSKVCVCYYWYWNNWICNTTYK